MKFALFEIISHERRVPHSISPPISLLASRSHDAFDVRRFPVTIMPPPLNESPPPTRRHDVVDFEKPRLPQDERELIPVSRSLSLVTERTLFPRSSSHSFVLPLCPVVAAGVARIHPRRGESHPLSLRSQAWARAYSRPF